MTRRAQRLMAMIALAIGLSPAAAAGARQNEPHMLDLPVQVAACEQDPGNKLQPGGGRFSPDEVMEEHNCEALEDISVTVWSRDDELDFFARCETDDEGLCRVEAPTDPERELNVALHMSTVPPGLSLAEPITTTVHYTEFTGVGIALLSHDNAAESTPERQPERRTFAIQVEQDGEPAEVLTQLSEGDVTIDEFPWLATNDEGWVSYDLGLFETGIVDLMIDVEGEPTIACSDIDNGGALDVQWLAGREGDFARITLPATDGNINCDVSLP